MSLKEKIRVTSVATGDIMTLDTAVTAFVMLVEDTENGFRDPFYGARVYFRWIAHPDASKLATCDWIWEKTLLDAAWLKVA